MSGVPIPQGATVDQAIPIPAGASVDADPAQLRQGLEASGAIPKPATRTDDYIPGLPRPGSQPIPKPIAMAIEATPMLAGVGEIPAAIDALGAASVPAARAVGTAAGTAVRLARTPVGKAVLEYTLKSAGAGAGYALAKKWLGL